MRGWRKLTMVLALIAVLLLGTVMVSAQGRGYIVGSGDVLDLIAAYFGVDQDCIAAASNLFNRSVIYPGQQLTIPTNCPPYDGSAGRGRIRGTVLGSDVPSPGTPPDQGGFGRYVIQPGDQLGLIALELGVSLNCLASANNIHNPDLIYAGQVIGFATCLQQGSPTIPTSPTVPTVPTVPTSPTTPSNPPDARYVVRPGDRLVDIAAQFDVDVMCLVQVNALPNQNVIRSGQVLDVGTCMGRGGGGAIPASQEYTVQPGDRLSNIAATFGVDVNCLIESNNITSPNTLFPGDTLVIDVALCGAPAPDVQDSGEMEAVG